VTITHLGEGCLQIYTDRLHELYAKKTELPEGQHFDAVILDYKMPDRNGLEVAKEILTIKPHQRIILAPDYLEHALIDAIKELSVPIQVLEKPISNKRLVDNIEDTENYNELKKLHLDIEPFDKACLSHELLRKILNILRKKDEDA
jgi:DNA-binding NtrC family response regulator